MNDENKNAYSEVIEILKWVDDEKKLEALPMEMLELLKSKSNSEYKPNLNKDIPLDEQNLQPETFAILNWISQKYWSDEFENNFEEAVALEENKEENNIIDIEEEKTKENVVSELENKENIGNIDTISDLDGTEKENSNLPVLFDNLKWYQKIKIKVIEFLNRIFRRNKSKENHEGNVL